jgi:hypothetical protein
MSSVVDKLREAVVYEARKVAALAPFVISASDDLCLAVRALERHEARIAELETRMEREAAK